MPNIAKLGVSSGRAEEDSNADGSCLTATYNLRQTTSQRLPFSKRPRSLDGGPSFSGAESEAPSRAEGDPESALHAIVRKSSRSFRGHSDTNLELY